jgi:hypothetical protein
MGCFMQASASYEYGTDSIDEVTHGVDVGGHVSPLRHGARGGEMVGKNTKKTSLSLKKW